MADLSTHARRLFRFPNPVDERSARLVAGGVVLLSAAAFGGCSAFVDICFDVNPLEH